MWAGTGRWVDALMGARWGKSLLMVSVFSATLSLTLIF